jgi:hypothetical protein
MMATDRPIHEALGRARRRLAQAAVPAIWTTTAWGDQVLKRWQREALIEEETPWLRDLAETAAILCGVE